MPLVFPVDGHTWPTRPLLKFGAHRSYELHQGVDIPAPEGTWVFAVETGRVVLVVTGYKPGWRGYGRCIAIEHVETLNGMVRTVYSFYAHLSRADVKVNDEVLKGTVIGAVGRTKWTTRALEQFGASGPHCHFEKMTRFPPRPRGTDHFRIVDRADPVLWFQEHEAQPEP